MRPDIPSEPWLSILNDLDLALDETIELDCVGGFAIVHAYGFPRATADIDVISVAPYESRRPLAEIAGKESALRRKHGIYFDIVTVATAPQDYQDRLIPLYPTCWKRLRLFCARSARSCLDEART